MRRLTLVLLSMLLFQTSLFSQSSDEVNAIVDITATVTSSIELITINTMSFGNVQPGQNEIYVNPINDTNAGFMIAIGTANAEFRLDYFEELTLTKTDGGNGNDDILFSYELSFNDIEEQSTSVIIDYDDRNITFNQDGRIYLWIGGRVNLTNASPGNYEGDFTIEIDYI